MLNPSDKELDRLSREAADHYEPDEQISSWEQLVPRLDREIGVKPNAGFRIFGRGGLSFAVAVIIIAGISLLISKQKTATNPTTTARTALSSSPSNKVRERENKTSQSSAIESQTNPENTTTKRNQNASGGTRPEDIINSADLNAEHDRINEENASGLNKSSKKLGKDKSIAGKLGNAQLQSSSYSNPESTVKNEKAAAGIATAGIS